MGQIVTARDGRNYTVFEERHLLEVIEEYAGFEVLECLKDFMAESAEAAEETAEENKELMEEIDELQDHQRLVLSEIYEDAERLMELTERHRLERKEISECAEKIWRTLHREL